MMAELAIGIDIGGTNTAYGVVTRNGAILTKGVIPTTGHEGLDGYVGAIEAALTPIVDSYGRTRFSGVGIGAPSGNFHTGEIVFSPNLPWKGVIPMAALMSEALGLKSALTNDAKAATIGEMIYGNAKDLSNFLMVTLGTGLGSGFVSNGKVIYGHDGLAGELGHVIAEHNGRICGCGRRGCLETYASATGIVRTAKAWLEDESVDTPLRALRDTLTAKDIQTAAQSGDAFALALYDYTGEILGRSLADAVAITSPDTIILFGGLANGRELIIAPTQRSMEANLLKIYQGKIRFLNSALPDSDSAILGASALVW